MSFLRWFEHWHPEHPAVPRRALSGWQDSQWGCLTQTKQKWGRRNIPTVSSLRTYLGHWPPSPPARCAGSGWPRDMLGLRVVQEKQRAWWVFRPRRALGRNYPASQKERRGQKRTGENWRRRAEDSRWQQEPRRGWAGGRRRHGSQRGEITLMTGCVH